MMKFLAVIGALAIIKWLFGVAVRWNDTRSDMKYLKGIRADDWGI